MLWFYISWIFCFMSSPALSESLSSQFHIPVEEYKLKNGLKVLLNPDKKDRTIYFILGVATGSRHEGPGITGISHMFEHLMFNGTKKYPHFEKTYTEKGVSSNAFTSHDYTAYLSYFLPERLDLVLDVESDRMMNLTVSQKDLDKEKNIVLEERKLRTDNSPFGFLVENMFDLLFVKHSYRQPIIGYSKDISNYRLEDLNKWYHTYYSPNNAVLVLSGAFNPSKAKKQIEKYFGPWASSTPSKTPEEIKVKEPEPEQSRSRVLNRKVQMPQVIMAYLAPPKASKEFYALDFIHHILGSGESSVLYKKMVRDQAWLSSINTGLIDLLDYSVFYVGYPLTDLSLEEKVKNQVLKEMQEGIEQLNNRSLEKVKNIFLNEMLDSLKKNRSRARMILDYEILFSDYKKIYEKLDQIDSMSLDFVQKTGEKYLHPHRLSYVILRPLAK